MIRRTMQVEEILEGFEEENPSYQVLMITGVRGSGKTVMLTEVARRLKDSGDWIIVDLSPERDLLQALAANLSNQPDLIEIFRRAKINLSFLGLGVEIEGAAPITDLSVAITRMLEHIGRHGKRVMITIDEAVCNQTMKEFASMFQIYMRQNLPVFLTMTGLYENIYELQNEKTLTFLYRAPRVELGPLNIGRIADSYRTTFDLDEDAAMQMAKETKGYPFAYQVLGYLCWKNEQTWEEVLPEYGRYLEDYVYEKLWNELSALDKKLLKAMASDNDGTVKSIREKLGMTSNKFSVYRERLLRKGLIASPEYGYLEFALPRFREFLRSQE